MYTEKAEQCKRVAEYCYENGMFESAANRYYYCLFILAKGILAQSAFDYKRFLRGSPHIDKQHRKHKKFAHTTIHTALAVHKNFNVVQFKKMWNIVYNSRITADYKDERFTKKEIDKCRRNFYSIYRRIRNGRL